MESTWYSKKGLALSEEYQAEIDFTINHVGESECGINGSAKLSSIFHIDYSKRGTAKCKKCRKVIIKDKLRIGKNVLFKDKHILQYYHVECSFRTFEAARITNGIITDINEINGVENVSEEDRLFIANLIKYTNKKSEKCAPRPIAAEPRKSTIVVKQTPRIRRNGLKSHTEPSIKIMFSNADQMTSSKMTELKNKIKQEQPLIVAICEVKPKTLSK